MGRIIVLLYGIVSYVIFLVSFLYTIGFLGRVVVPKHINSGPETSPVSALIINSVLLSLFAIQHSGMARRSVKEKLKAVIPDLAERSTYVLLSSLLILLLVWQWRPMTDPVWKVQTQFGTALIYGIFGLGWVIVLTGTFMIDHFDLFGLRQVYCYYKEEPREPISFQAPYLYKYVRHPLMLGFTIAFWATPLMTTGHLLFATATTGYILLGIYFEERALKERFGEQYEKYREQVPMLLPIPGYSYSDPNE